VDDHRIVNGNADLQIERDLVRWPRARWVAVILAAVLFQGASLFFVPRALPGARTNYPREPTVSFVRFTAPSEWLALQDNSLFASANPQGFSGPAWIIETARVYVAPDALPSPAFLAFSEVDLKKEAAGPIFAVLPHTRPLPDPTALSITSPSREPESRIELEGFRGRRLVSPPDVPVQYASDALRPTVVKALVDSEGSIFSCRVVESSGSKIVDNSAVDLTRKMRFSRNNPNDRPESFSNGKLTFNWYAVDASATNAVPGKGTQR
jgi:TonB family protein